MEHCNNWETQEKQRNLRMEILMGRDEGEGGWERYREMRGCRDGRPGEATRFCVNCPRGSRGLLVIFLLNTKLPCWFSCFSQVASTVQLCAIVS